MDCFPLLKLKPSPWMAMGIVLGPIASADAAQVGLFTLEWDSHRGQLSVSHSSHPSGPVWLSAPQGFLHAGLGREKVDSRRGCFVFSDVSLKDCGQGVVEELKSLPSEARLVGHWELCPFPFELSFSSPSSHTLSFRLQAGSGINRTSMAFVSGSAEGLFGFGAQYSHLDMQGMRVPIWSGEQGIGRGDEPISRFTRLFAGGCAGDEFTTYTAVPYVLSTENKAMVLENPERSVFDATRSGSFSFELWSGDMKGHLMVGNSLLDTITEYTQLAGRMDPLPDWSQRGVLLRAVGGTQAVEAALSEALRAGARVAALWIEDWCGQRTTPFGSRILWNWSVDRGLYPNWEQLLERIRAQGIRTLIYFNPFLSKIPAGQGGEDLYSEARVQEFLVHDSRGHVRPVGNGGFEAGLLDLTNPSARAFIKNIMRQQLTLGVSGWMSDFGEALPYDALLFSGEDPRSFHNLYPLEWARLSREAIREAGRDGDAVFFSRSGNWQSPGVSRAFWIGDQNVTWGLHDGIKSVVPALLSSGLSGYSLQHMDLGGWLSLRLPQLGMFRTRELLWRWMEIGVFGALFRTHHTNLAAQNFQYDSDPETLAQFARMTRLFAALAPYRERLMKEASEKGWPLVRHPMLHFPDDPALRQASGQFLLGADILVAPVTDPGAVQVDVYLPTGRWVDPWSAEVLDGGRLLAGRPAPLGRPVFFVREGARVLQEIESVLREF